MNYGWGNHHLSGPQGGFPSVSQAVGNSFALPVLAPDEIQAMGPNVANHGEEVMLYDQSYRLNAALWDGWFFSSVAPQESELIKEDERRDIEQVIEDALRGSKGLPNSRYIFDSGGVVGGDSALVGELMEDDGYEKISSHLLCLGSFNVNSTSKEAWKAFLGSLDGRVLKYLDDLNGAFKEQEGQLYVSRFTLPNSEAVDSYDGGGIQSDFLKKRWSGVRSLSMDEVDELAENIVEEVRLRGPFLSLGEFLNRRLDDTPLGLSGALQSAIDKTSINASFEETSELIDAADVSEMAYSNPKAAIGVASAGAPGYITQADLLMPVASQLSVRSDTFRISAYGESTDQTGRVASRVWCEAIVRRGHEFVDMTNDADTQVVNVDGSPTHSLSEINRSYGRRFEVISFRWLTGDEV